MGLLGGLIVGALIGVAMSGSGCSDDRCGNCGGHGQVSHVNSRGKTVYVCPHCGHRWSK